MRPRHFAVLAILALLAIVNYAEIIASKAEFLWHAPELGAIAMHWFTDLDVWLLSNNIEPVLVGLGLTVLLSGWVIPDIWPHIRERFSSASLGTFGAAFRASECTDARQEFRLAVEKAYTEYCRTHNNSGRNEKSLISLLDQTQFPDDFPPPAHEPLSGCMASATWHSEESVQLRRFLQELYAPTSDADKEALLPEPDLRSMMRARNIVSKFWDDCGREILAGRLPTAPIKRQLDSNARDIKLLAVSELVLSEMLPWDTGGGKTSLFHLATEGSGLKRERRRR